MLNITPVWIKILNSLIFYAGGVSIFDILLEKRWTSIKSEKTETENGWAWQKQKSCCDDRGEKLIMYI